MPSCLGCSHSVVDHGDRAVIPCAQTVDVEGATYQWRKIRCFCPGWDEGEAAVPLWNEGKNPNDLGVLTLDDAS